MILAIDPGPEKSGVVVYDNDRKVIVESCIEENDRVICRMHTLSKIEVIIEWVEPYGARVGSTTFRTVYWIGRFAESARREVGDRWTLVSRRDLKRKWGLPMNATDTDIRNYILDMFGGIRKVAVGTKKQPGPLYGLKGHCWQALALALMVSEDQTQSIAG